MAKKIKEEKEPTPNLKEIVPDKYWCVAAIFNQKFGKGLSYPVIELNDKEATLVCDGKKVTLPIKEFNVAFRKVV